MGHHLHHHHHSTNTIKFVLIGLAVLVLVMTFVIGGGQKTRIKSLTSQEDNRENQANQNQTDQSQNDRQEDSYNDEGKPSEIEQGRVPMLTFIDDDGNKKAADSWERIVDATDVPVTMAIITSRMGLVTEKNTYMSWDDIERLSQIGFEFISHTNNHKDITTLSDEELVDDLEQTSSLLREHGCNPDFLVFPQNASDERTLQIVKQYFKGSFRGGNLVNVPTIDKYQLTRVNLLNKEEAPLTLSAMKKWVDSAVEKQGWIVFMGHNYYESFDAKAEENLIELIKYAQSQGVQIVSVAEGFEYYSSFGNE